MDELRLMLAVPRFLHVDYRFSSLEELLNLEFTKMLDLNLRYTKCRRCGRYFPLKGNRDAKYCENIAEGETKPAVSLRYRKTTEPKLRTSLRGKSTASTTNDIQPASRPVRSQRKNSGNGNIPLWTSAMNAPTARFPSMNLKFGWRNHSTTEKRRAEGDVLFTPFSNLRFTPRMHPSWYFSDFFGKGS